MPFVKQIITESYHVLVWEITEDLDFFAKDIRLSFLESQEYAAIVNENRKLEWMASRFVQRQLINDSLEKDEWGKPSLVKEPGFVSIAHSKTLATAIYSKKNPVGIDIEPIHEKALRIKHKFLNEKELLFIDPEYEAEHIIACWCIKEAVYKWYGKKSLSFKGNIKIQAFDFNSNEVYVDFEFEDFQNERRIYLEKVGDSMLAFTF